MVDVELLFGAERLIFYYLSESRIDFRDLVKDLAREFQTRIEMRQIGIRDEAKLLADFGDCGKPVCCNSHMIEMPPVSMKMARMQKASLDPAKISGRCGRLKCCLRFEQDVYDLHQKELPEVGTLITTEKGKGWVLAQEILSRRLLVEFEDGRRISIMHSEVIKTSSN
jgi:cell fate regulator YaaT (PSP1 superfamily)